MAPRFFALLKKSIAFTRQYSRSRGEKKGIGRGMSARWFMQTRIAPFARESLNPEVAPVDTHFLCIYRAIVASREQANLSRSKPG